MPICIGCNQKFPNVIKLANQKWLSLHKRKYCITCSPIGSRHKCGPKSKYKECDIINCLKCDKIIKRGKKLRNLVCSTCRSRELRHKNKTKLVNLLGGKCKKCNYNKSLSALDFHHLDPLNKKFTIALRLHTSINILEEEAKKCELLCRNCHAELHNLWPHGGTTRRA